MNKSNLLKIPVLLIVLLSIAFPVSSFGVAAETVSGQALDTPVINILASSSDYMDLRIQFPANPIYDNPGGVIFNTAIYSHPSDVGTPDLPVLRKSIEFPFGSDYSVEILDSISFTGTLGADGLPAEIPSRAAESQKCEPGVDCDIIEVQPAIEETEEPVGEETEEPVIEETEEPVIEETEEPVIEETEEPVVEETEEPVIEETEEPVVEETADVMIQDTEESFPVSPVQLLDTFVIRGHQVGNMQFWPVTYKVNAGTVEIYQEITVRITFHQEAIRTMSDSSAAYTSSTYENLLGSEIINYNQGMSVKTTSDKANEAILIIAPDAFITTLSSLVSLKQSQGHPVTLVGLSTTGSTPNGIKSYIQSAYDNWTLPPTYVILVGDTNNGANTMPAYTGLSSSSATDLYYGTVDGTDWIPDVFVGRLPARNTTQLSTMINNLANYNTLTGAESWIKKAAFLASNDSNYWQVAEGTQNYVIQNHTQPEGYWGTFPSSTQAGGDKLYAYSYSAGNTQVVNAVNNRRALVAYTGHGSRTSWGGPSFSQSNIRNITSTGTYSVVTSFACLTGDFGTTESFGETWLLQANKGAVTFIGSSANTYWGPDDTLERAMMDSLYSGASSANIVSSFKFAGLMAIENTRPGTGTAQSRYYWESYNLLGDPSLRMLISAPDYQPRFETSLITVGQAPGEQVTAYLKLTNAGMNTDFYNLDLQSSGWAISVMSSKTISLEPGQSTTVEISFTIPEDAEYGQEEQSQLLVTSGNDPDVPKAMDTATIDVKVFMLSFIPMVISP